MKFNPAILLFILLALGGTAAFFLAGAKPEVPPAMKAAPAAATEVPPPLTKVPPVAKTAPQAPAVKPETAPLAASTGLADDLKKQIVLLEGQIEYLQGQNDALKDENAQLIQKLGMLGVKDAPKMTPGKDDDVPPDFVGMGLEMMKMRKLHALPLVTTAISQEEVEIVIQAWLKRQQPNDEAKKFARGLAALGWIPEAIDPLPLRAALLARQLGGWYDEESETMFTVDPATASGSSVTANEPLGIAVGQLLREYGPVLFQPQHGPLKTDMRLARESLIFGDAALTRFLHSLQKPAGAPVDDLPPEDPDHPLNQVAMPAFLRELALFPFSRGFEFAQTLHSAGNFAQLNAAYSRPPVTTAEVIEPEVYLEPERPAPVEIKLDGVKLKGVLPYLDDCLGKFACVTALRTYNDDEHAAQGARGLVADRLLAWTADGGAKRDHAAWQTLFMDKASADAFYKAMLNCLKERYATKGENEFAAQGRFVCLLRNRGDAGVALIEAASDEARTALKLLLK